MSNTPYFFWGIDTSLCLFRQCRGHTSTTTTTVTMTKTERSQSPLTFLFYKGLFICVNLGICMCVCLSNCVCFWCWQGNDIDYFLFLSHNNYSSKKESLSSGGFLSYLREGKPADNLCWTPNRDIISEAIIWCLFLVLRV